MKNRVYTQSTLLLSEYKNTLLGVFILPIFNIIYLC